MGFFGAIFDFLGGAVRRPIPPSPRPLDPADSPEEQLKDSVLNAADLLIYQAAQVYVKSMVDRLPNKSKQLEVVDALIGYLSDYRALLAQGPVLGEGPTTPPVQQ